MSCSDCSVANEAQSRATWDKESHLGSRLHRSGLWACLLGIFFNWQLMWKGCAYCGQCRSWMGGFGGWDKLWGVSQEAMLALPWPVLQILPPGFCLES